MVLMVQKEVALRIVAKDRRESILSTSVKAYGMPKIVTTVKAGSFFPKPNVDSAILVIQNISRDFFLKNPARKSCESTAPISEKKFFETVKKGFAHKRKLVKGNLSASEETLRACGIAPAARPENLTTEQWLCLAG